jgi:hypothetical protein
MTTEHKLPNCMVKLELGSMTHAVWEALNGMLENALVSFDIV